MSNNSERTAPRLAFQTPGVINITRNIVIQLFAVVLVGRALAGQPAVPMAASDPTGLQGAAPVGKTERASPRWGRNPEALVIDTNTPAMREAARIKADLQSLVLKIQAAVAAANTANRGNVTNYVVELSRLADLIAETAQSKLGEGGELLKPSTELLKTMDKKLDDLVAKSRDLKNPANSDYEKLILRVKAAKDILLGAQKMTSKCREDLVAEATRLRSLSVFLADAAEIDAFQDAVDAFAAALNEATAFTVRLKTSVDGLLSRAASTAHVVVE
jgi:hypothetical protein